MIPCMLLAAVLAASLTATPPIAPPPAAPAAAPTPAFRTFTPPPARIEIIELGDEPRRPLRAAPVVGRTEEVELVVEPLLNRFVDGDLTINEKPVPVRIPLALRPREALPDGGVRLEATVGEAAPKSTAAGDAGQVAAIASALDRLRGAAIEIDLDRRGAVAEVRVPAASWPDGAEGTTVDRVVRGIVRLFVPTPDDALGVGGRWRVLFDDRLAPIARREMLVLRIARLDDALAECERYAIWSELRTLQRVPEDMVPSAPDAVLTHLAGRGGGTMTIARDAVAAAALDDQSFVKFFAEGRDPSDGSLRQLHEQTMVKTTARRVAER